MWNTTSAFVCPHGSTWLPPDGFSRNLMLEIFNKILNINFSTNSYFDRVPRMNVNPFVPCTSCIFLMLIMKHSEISWCSRDIKTYLIHTVHLNVPCIIKYSFARVFCIFVYACIVKIVHLSVVLVKNSSHKDGVKTDIPTCEGELS